MHWVITAMFLFCLMVTNVRKQNYKKIQSQNVEAHEETL